MHDKYMRIAINKAHEGVLRHEYPFGCCIICEGVTIATNNTCISSRSVIRHAEINAIETMCKQLKKLDLSNAVIYTTTEPCTMCLAAISWAKIPILVYGTRKQYSTDMGFPENELSSSLILEASPNKIALCGGILEEECKNLFIEWQTQNCGLFAK